MSVLMKDWNLNCGVVVEDMLIGYICEVVNKVKFEWYGSIWNVVDYDGLVSESY